MSEEQQIRMKLDSTKAQFNLVAAVLIGPAGGRKIVKLAIANQESIQDVKNFINITRPVLKKKEKLFMMKYMGVSAERLETVADLVRLLD